MVVDLWAPWCGPCRTLGPIIEQVVDATDGAVALAKVNVDENPAISASFKVQSIPAVFALKDGKVVDGFIGALPEAAVSEFVAKLTPGPSEADLLVAEGLATDTEEPLRRALELQPDHEGAISGLAGLLIAGAAPTRPSPCSAGSPRPRPPGCSWPRPGWRASRSTWTPTGSGRCSTGCWNGCATTPQPVRSSSISSRHSDPTTPARPTTARRWPPGSSDRPRPGATAAGTGARPVASRSCRPPGDARRHHLRPQRPGPGHGDPEPDARLLLRQRGHFALDAWWAGPSSWSTTAPICWTSGA